MILFEDMIQVRRQHSDLRTVVMVSIGYNPLRVSAPSKTPSVPSRTAFATSVASARVGQGLSTIESTTRVITAGLPAKLHLLSATFWNKNTFSGGRSMPRFPRERMIPSASFKISSNWANPSQFSILARICVCQRSPSFDKWERANRTSSACRVYERDKKSIWLRTPQVDMIFRSDALSVGSSIRT